MHKSLYKKFYYISNFDKEHIEKIDKDICLIYRNYKEDLDITNLKNLRNFCKNRGHKVFLANNLKLARSLYFDGVYLPSFNNERFRKENLKKNFIILGSAHNIKEIKIKQKQFVDYIFVSPLFNTKDKKGLGISRFSCLINDKINNYIALGGIKNNNLNQLSQLNISGYAGISFVESKINEQ